MNLSILKISFWLNKRFEIIADFLRTPKGLLLTHLLLCDSWFHCRTTGLKFKFFSYPNWNWTKNLKRFFHLSFGFPLILFYYFRGKYCIFPFLLPVSGCPNWSFEMPPNLDILLPFRYRRALSPDWWNFFSLRVPVLQWQLKLRNFCPGHRSAMSWQPKLFSLGQLHQQSARHSRWYRLAIIWPAHGQ